MHAPTPIRIVNMPDFETAGIISYIQILVDDKPVGQISTPGCMPRVERVGDVGYTKLNLCKTQFVNLVCRNKGAKFKVKGYSDESPRAAEDIFILAFGDDFFGDDAPALLSRVPGQKSTAKLELLSCENIGDQKVEKLGNRGKTRAKIQVRYLHLRETQFEC